MVTSGVRSSIHWQKYEQKACIIWYQTIGDLARADEDVLNSHFGKMGSILWSFANGYDDSPVKLENTHAPNKSVGNSTTTPKAFNILR